MKKLTDAEKEKRRYERGMAAMQRYRQKQREQPGAIQTKTKLPKGALENVKRWASESASKGAIARRLGMDHKTFRVLMEQNPDLKAAYDEGVETEHHELVSALKRQMHNSPVPAIFLLKTRHGYREGDQSELGNRVSVTFNLPGAQSLDAFRRGTIIEHDSGGDDGRDADS
jgi:hypothetical protein